MRTPLLLLDPGLALAVKLIEADRRRRVGRRKHSNWNCHQTDLEVPSPRRTCCHFLLLDDPQSPSVSAGAYKSDRPRGFDQQRWTPAARVKPTIACILGFRWLRETHHGVRPAGAVRLAQCARCWPSWPIRPPTSGSSGARILSSSQSTTGFALWSTSTLNPKFGSTHASVTTRPNSFPSSSHLWSVLLGESVRRF